jgi:UDP-N-acetylmuramate dehydrogenase
MLNKSIFPLSLPKLRGQLLSQVPLSDYTSWRVGGPAEWLFKPADLADLQHFLQHLPPGLPLTWLGLGSNTLVRDKGIAGVVIITQGLLQQLTLVSEGTVRAEAGVACAQLARFTARQGLTGLEFLAGIPGTVGGALAMNAGCFGGEIWERVLECEMVDRHGQLQTRAKRDFLVSYRHVDSPAEEWFVSGTFTLRAGDREKALSDIKSLLGKRNASQPTGSASCGSVFRNPPDTYAGKLIEQCGLKNKRVGGAVVSSKHANFILNEGSATAADIEELIHVLQAEVEKQTQIHLQPEVHILGRN